MEGENQSIIGSQADIDGNKESLSLDKRVKRKAIDKQAAFIEFKGGEGKKIEDSIVHNRNEVKTKKEQVKQITQVINVTKQEIDKIKELLDRKEHERKLRAGEFQNDFADDEDGNPEEIIDEEELMLLKE